MDLPEKSGSLNQLWRVEEVWKGETREGFLEVVTSELRYEE